VIDDARGNANGNIEPGEMVNLSLGLTNGWASATNVSARISTTDPFVTIIKEWANFPPVNHGALVNNAADPFIISLDPACPQTHTINFTLNIAADRATAGYAPTSGPYNYSRTCLFTYAIAVNQLVYEDGQVDGYIGYGGKGGALAVRITPQSYPCYPTHIRLFPYGDSTITVNIWDNDGPRGLPGTVLGSVNVDVKATGDWFDVDISSLGLKIDSGSFYAGWVEGDKSYYNGLDADPPYYHRSWAYFYSFNVWAPFEDVGLLANLMVRVREDSIADAPVQNITTGRKYFSIQTAINGARSGEQIVVSKGTYYESIYFKGKNLVVRSTVPNDSAIVAATVIKGNSDVVTFSGWEDANCVLAGFTITGGNRGIYCPGSPTITNCVVTKNAGEGVYICYASPILANCMITGNGASGIAVDPESEPAISNCTIAGNRGGGITVNWGTPKITNSIIWGNWPAQVAYLYGTVLISYSDIQGGRPGQGNINADPYFVSAGYWANPNDPNIPVEPNQTNAIWVQGDYHLKSQGWRWNSNRGEWDSDHVTSRAIDAGSPGSLLGDEPMTVPDDPGNIWGQNLRIDMGAFGGTDKASMPPHKWAILGDLTNDGTLDLPDLALLAETWLNGGSESAADLNRDCVVDMLDFALLAEDWLAETSWHR